MLRAPLFFRACLVLAALALTACDSHPITSDDEISFDGEVVTSDGTFTHAAGDEPYSTIFFYGDHMDAAFHVARPGEPGIIVSMTADFHGGQFVDEPLPVRVCSCHILPDREGDEFVPQCEDDEERVCTELTAKLTGTYVNDDCDDEDCLTNLHASLELPPGFEFDGRVRLVHEEEWYSDSSHQLL